MKKTDGQAERQTDIGRAMHTVGQKKRDFRPMSRFIPLSGHITGVVNLVRLLQVVDNNKRPSSFTVLDRRCH